MKIIKTPPQGVNMLAPSEELKGALYQLYIAVFKSSISENHKQKILTSILAYEPWSWRVVGISKNALKAFADYNFRYRTRAFQRDHHFQNRIITFRKMLKNRMLYEEWWAWFWENDRTLLVTNTEHSQQNYTFKEDIIPIDWKKGFFQCQKTAGFACTVNREGRFLEKLAKEYQIE